MECHGMSHDIGAIGTIPKWRPDIRELVKEVR